MRWLHAPLALLFGAALAAQSAPGGPEILTFYSPADDTDQPYAVYIPQGYSTGKAWPLVVSLHGAFSNHRVNLRRVFGQGNRDGETDAEAMRYFPPLPAAPYFVASPLARGTMGYRGLAERDVWAMLEDVKRRFRIDEDRVYLTGLSMGGGGTLELGLKYPDVWAAIVPLCPVPPHFGEDHAGNALNVPVYFHHGVDDKVVPVAVTRQWSKLMREAGARVEVKEYPGVQHNVWDFAYRDADLFKWLGRRRRVRFPERVYYATDDPLRTKAYWVKGLTFAPGVTARITARFEGPNVVGVETAGVDGFELELAGHPHYRNRQAVVVKVNGEVHRFEPGAPVRVGTRGTAWAEARQATSGRHVYVYGTADNPPPAERMRRRETAARAADWIGGGRRLNYFPRVLADREIRPSDFEANLIVFGNAKTNQIVAKLGGRARLSLRAGKEVDHGLVYAVPGETPGTVIVVNEGLPWWQGGERTSRGGYGFLPLQHRILMSIDEFLLFRGGVAEVVAEGFLAQQWAKLPAEVVEVR